MSGIDAGLVLPPPPQTMPQVAYAYDGYGANTTYSQSAAPPSRRGPPPTNSSAQRVRTAGSLPSQLTSSNATYAANPIPANRNSNFYSAATDGSQASQFQYEQTTANVLRDVPYPNNFATTRVNIEQFSYEAADAVNGVTSDGENESEEGVVAEQRFNLNEDGVELELVDEYRGGRSAFRAGEGVGDPASPDKPSGEVMWMAR